MKIKQPHTFRCGAVVISTQMSFDKVNYLTVKNALVEPTVSL